APAASGWSRRTAAPALLGTGPAALTYASLVRRELARLLVFLAAGLWLRPERLPAVLRTRTAVLRTLIERWTGCAETAAPTSSPAAPTPAIGVTVAELLPLRLRRFGLPVRRRRLRIGRWLRFVRGGLASLRLVHWSCSLRSDTLPTRALLRDLELDAVFRQQVGADLVALRVVTGLSRAPAEVRLGFGHPAPGRHARLGDRPSPFDETVLRGIHAGTREVQWLAVADAEREQPERKRVVAPLLQLREEIRVADRLVHALS